MQWTEVPNLGISSPTFSPLFHPGRHRSHFSLTSLSSRSPKDEENITRKAASSYSPHILKLWYSAIACLLLGDVKGSRGGDETGGWVAWLAGGEEISRFSPNLISALISASIFCEGVLLPFLPPTRPPPSRPVCSQIVFLSRHTR